jgi:micrococcal nuclease
MYDADTMKVSVDLGFSVVHTVTLRLNGIDAWEIRGEERPLGLKARTWLQEQVKIGDTVFIETVKDRTGKYGRYLADVYIPNRPPHSGWRNLNAELVDFGHAEWVKW